MSREARQEIARPTLVLIHGLGSRGRDFELVVSHLTRVAPGVTVEAPDLPGHGSAPPPGGEVSLESFAAGLVEGLPEGRPVVLAGFSFGSWVALQAWGMVPDRIDGIVLVDPALAFGALFEWAARGGASRRGLYGLARKSLRRVGLEPNARRIYRRATSGKSREEAVEKVTAVYHARDVDEAARLMAENPLTRDLEGGLLRANAESLMAADRPTVMAGLEILPSPDAWSRPAGSDVIPLVLRGEKSIVCPGSRAEALATAIGGRVESVPCGHCAHLEAPGAVAEALGKEIHGIIRSDLPAV